MSTFYRKRTHQRKYELGFEPRLRSLGSHSSTPDLSLPPKTTIPLTSSADAILWAPFSIYPRAAHLRICHESVRGGFLSWSLAYSPGLAQSLAWSDGFLGRWQRMSEVHRLWELGTLTQTLSASVFSLVNGWINLYLTGLFVRKKWNNVCEEPAAGPARLAIIISTTAGSPLYSHR